MEKNVHIYDRIARIVLGLGLLVFFVLSNHDLRVLALLGFIPLITGFVGFCFVYSLLGINGCASKKSS